MLLWHPFYCISWTADPQAPDKNSNRKNILFLLALRCFRAVKKANSRHSASMDAANLPWPFPVRGCGFRSSLVWPSRGRGGEGETGRKPDRRCGRALRLTGQSVNRTAFSAPHSSRLSPEVWRAEATAGKQSRSWLKLRCAACWF